MASSLATSGIENGALRSFSVSLLGHLVLIGTVFFLPMEREKIYIEEIPRSVKLIATLEEPKAAPAPKAVPAPKPKPKPKPKPRVITPTPVAPKPARSKVQIPVKEAPPLVQPRPPSPAAPSLGEKLAKRLAAVESTPAPPVAPARPAVPIPEITPLPAPVIPSTAPPASSREKVVPLTDFPYSWYVAIVKDRIFSRWTPPSSYALGGRSIAAVTSFRITKEGKVSRISLQKGSGHRLFDQSAMATLKSLSALPALPKEYKEDFLDVVIQFQSQNH